MEPLVSGDTWVEWDDGTDQVVPNGGPVHRSWTAGDVLDVYDVFLEGGKTYGFNLVASGLSARLDGFREFVRELLGNVHRMWTMGPGESYTYACPISDWYGLVVVHQDMNPGAYDLSVVAGRGGRGRPVARDGVTALEPNPARGLLRVQYALRERGSVGFRVLDVGGREVWRREPEMCDAGRWSLVWDPERRRRSPARARDLLPAHDGGRPPGRAAQGHAAALTRRADPPLRSASTTSGSGISYHSSAPSFTVVTSSWRVNVSARASPLRRACP